MGIFLSEVDIERLPIADEIPSSFLYLVHGTGRTLLLVVLLGIILWQARSLISTVRKNIAALVFTPTGFLMMSAFLLLLLSDVFEKSILGGHYHVFYEELMELNGYFLFLVAAMHLKTSLAGLFSHQAEQNTTLNVAAQAG